VPEATLSLARVRCTYRTWGLVGPSANLDFVEERKMLWPCQEMNPDSSVS